MWLSDFLLAQWLWGMTWGFYHIPFTIIIMTFLIKKSLKWTVLQSTTFSLMINLASLAAYTFGVIGIINYTQGPAHDLHCQGFGMVSAFKASIFLGLTYTVLDVIFFYLLSFFFKFGLRAMVSIALLSNGLSALIVYLMQPLLG